MKFKLLFTGALLALSSAVFAMPEAPDKCPSPAAISQAGIEKNLSEVEGRGWFFSTRGKFDTNTMWYVGTSELTSQAGSYEAALWRVKVFLNQIAILRDGPLYVKEKNHEGWLCEYETYNKFMMWVMTPAPDNSGQSFPSIMKKLKDVRHEK